MPNKAQTHSNFAPESLKPRSTPIVITPLKTSKFISQSNISEVKEMPINILQNYNSIVNMLRCSIILTTSATILGYDRGMLDCIALSPCLPQHVNREASQMSQDHGPSPQKSIILSIIEPQSSTNPYKIITLLVTVFFPDA